MEIIYYRTKKGYVPAKIYLTERYALSENDNGRTKIRKSKAFRKVDSIIKMAADNKGRAGGAFSSPLIGCDFQELRIKEGDDLIRVLYISYREEKLVLLNAYDKPNNYEKSEKNKVEIRIKDIHEETKKYYEDFLKNPEQYEKYE